MINRILPRRLSLRYINGDWFGGLYLVFHPKKKRRKHAIWKTHIERKNARIPKYAPALWYKIHGIKLPN